MSLEKQILKDVAWGNWKLLSPERRRCAVEHARETYEVSERHSCRPLTQWLAKVGTETLYIEAGGLWENGYCESFNGKLGDEYLNLEIFYSLKEAQIVIEKWRVERLYKQRSSSERFGKKVPMSVFIACGGSEFW